MTAGHYPSAGSAQLGRGGRPLAARSARARRSRSQRPEPPQVALDLARVDLAAGQVEVRLAMIRRSSPLSAIHLASTSSESGSRGEPYGRVSSGNSTQYSFSSRPVCGR